LATQEKLMGMLTVGSGGVPVGNYRATFIGVKPQEANAERGYPAGLRWEWRIDDGPQAGQTASRITGSQPTPRNGCGKILQGLLGRALVEGENIAKSTITAAFLMMSMSNLNLLNRLMSP
jgi:hypothetical protein